MHCENKPNNPQQNPFSNMLFQHIIETVALSSFPNTDNIHCKKMIKEDLVRDKEW